jgi:pheromone shutdown-related protein TraB
VTTPPSDKTAQALRLRRIEREGREGPRLVVVDLPRVDEESMAALKDFLEAERPEAVAVERDDQRLHWLSDREAWESVNLLELLKKKQGSLLASYLALRIFQKRFGSFDGLEPGDEMCLAVGYAEAEELPIHLIDRHMTTTAVRAWRCTPFFGRPRLALELTLGPFRRSRPRPEAEDDHALHERLQRVGRSMPRAAQAYLDEREFYMARKIEAIDADCVVAIVSTAHAEAVAGHLADPPSESFAGQLKSLECVPARSVVGAMMPWLLSAGLVGLFVWIVSRGETQAIHDTLLGWVLINGLFTTLFTAAAMAHPVTVLAAALSSPIVSLIPAIGAGFVGAFVQAFLVPPTVVDIERVGEDIARLSGWWRNRLARLVLIIVFANLGSTVGTFVALALFPNLLD